MKRGMKKLLKKGIKEDMKCNTCKGVCGGGIYFLGFIGSLVYHVQNSTSFLEGVLGVLKSLAWPAFIVYRILSGQPL